MWDQTCGRAAVRKGRLWGYIDTRGRVVIEPKYDWVTFFDGDTAKVCLAGRELFIDTVGREIPEYTVVQQGLRRLPWRGAPRHPHSAISDRDYMRLSPLSAPRNYPGHRRNPNEHTGGAPWGS